MVFDPIAHARAQRDKAMATLLPVGNNSIVIKDGEVRNDFTGTMYDAKDVEHKVPMALGIPEKNSMFLTEFSLDRQWVQGVNGPKEKKQLVAGGTVYVVNATLYFVTDEGLVEYPLRPELKKLGFSIHWQKFAANEAEAKRLGKFLEEKYGWTRPEGKPPPKNEQDHPAAAKWEIISLAVPVDNESTRSRRQVTQQRINHAQDHGPFISEMEIGENWQPAKPRLGFRDFLWNLQLSLDNAMDRADSKDEARIRVANALATSLTGNRESDELVGEDGKAYRAVYAERCDTGRLTIMGEEYDLWTQKATPAEPAK